MVTKSDYINWKQDLVTKAFFEYINLEISDIKEDLAQTAGYMPAEDRWKVGGIDALNLALEWNPIVETKTEEETSAD